ncbi:predicted protein [Chaetomium globosum CBS 148.51]|uniref:Uncharacterized protein n=1 Tax=Chaetomium globosum (strain ATCC 6205 / CBS 148.51 / DSM 1962 / NBRC 6347 / NRRL 1970) TaxID=306901 RepID=Q2H4P2_CHAGB|nr:uncharacterized protein CHGG_06373 [Chaetomium globosum CBS 148.51]EAQ89754.1 predicted protein [Chaetomium globosum CBS 148.51]
MAGHHGQPLPGYQSQPGILFHIARDHMATSMLDDVPRFAHVAIESLGPEDFETASVRSIRSAAPSYTSDAPSYHSTNPHPDPLPAYSPPARSTTAASTSTTTTAAPAVPAPRNNSVSSLLDLEPTPSSSSSTTTSSSSNAPRRYGLPPVPTGPPRHQSDIPSLARFRTAAWSPASGGAHANPTARIYQNVALRRASASGSSSGSSSGAGASASAAAAATANLDGLMRRVMLERIEEEEERRNRVRPLEDPYLVGEDAAARARAERMARESVRGGGDEVLIREDRPEVEWL